MSIDKIGHIQQNANSSKSTAKGKSPTETTKALPPEADSLKFTHTINDLKSALAAADAAPVVNSERVAAVKSDLENGTYQVDAEQIAEKMVAFEKLFPDSDTR